MGLVALVQIAARFILIEGSGLAFVAFAVLPVVAFAGAWVFRPGIWALARAGDALGMQERLVTAVELITAGKGGHPVVQDAIRTAEGAELARAYRYNVRRPAYALGVAVAVLGVASVMPPFRAEAIETQRQLRGVLAEEAEAIREVAQAAMEHAGVDAAREIEQATEGLLRELALAQNEAEAIRQVHAAQARIQSLAHNSVNQDLLEIGRRLQEHESFGNLGAALESGAFSSIEHEIQALADALAGASAQQRAMAAEALAEAARDLADSLQDGSLAQLLEDMSRALEEGAPEGLNNAMDDLAREMQRLAMENAELRQALGELERAMRDRLEPGSSPQPPGGEGTPGQQNQGQGSEQQGQQGQQGQQPGESAQQGQQLGEPGEPGEQGVPGQGQEGGGAPGSGRGFGHIESTNIYTRGAQHLGEFEAQITGIQDEDGASLMQEVRNVGEAGEMRPLSEVIVEYSEAQLRQLEAADIPFGMRRLVEDYFTGLHEGAP